MLLVAVAVVCIEVGDTHDAVVDRIGRVDVTGDETTAAGMTRENDAGLSGDFVPDCVDKPANTVGIIRPLLSPRRPASTDLRRRLQVDNDDVFVRIEFAQRTRLCTNILNEEVPIT